MLCCYSENMPFLFLTHIIFFPDWLWAQFFPLVNFSLLKHQDENLSHICLMQILRVYVCMCVRAYTCTVFRKLEESIEFPGAKSCRQLWEAGLLMAKLIQDLLKTLIKRQRESSSVSWPRDTLGKMEARDGARVLNELNSWELGFSSLRDWVINPEVSVCLLSDTREICCVHFMEHCFTSFLLNESCFSLKNSM